MQHTIPTPTESSKTGETHQFLKRPLILAGATRSGTTMLRLMLDSHPRIAFQSEMDYAFYHFDDETRLPDAARFREDLVTHPFLLASGLTIHPTLGPREQIDHIIRQKRDRDGKRVVGLTIHHDFDRALRVWPDARFIYLFRDGRDVARSIVQMGWSGNMYQAVDAWITAEKTWADLSRRTPSVSGIEVRYEELVRHPHEVLTNLCEFIGVPFNTAMFNYADRSSYEFPSPRFAEQWRTKVSPGEIALVEARIADMLVARGYELSGQPRQSITPWKDLYYRAQSWLRVMEFSRRRYGTPYVLARAVVKRIGPDSWRHWHRKWWYSIEKDYLK
jgi:Sulfotransferase family